MPVFAAIILSWVFSYYVGCFVSRYKGRAFTNAAIGISALLGTVVGFLLGAGIR